MVERLHDYLERSFLPGRRFSSPADFNAQLTGFFARANGRQMRVLSRAPADRLAADLGAMLPLPPVPPQVGWHHSTRLPRDHYIRLDANDYSVHPRRSGDGSTSTPTWTASGPPSRERSYRPRTPLGPPPDNHRLQAPRGREAAAAADGPTCWPYSPTRPPVRSSRSEH